MAISERAKARVSEKKRIPMTAMAHIDMKAPREVACKEMLKEGALFVNTCSRKRVCVQHACRDEGKISKSDSTEKNPPPCATLLLWNGY